MSLKESRKLWSGKAKSFYNREAGSYPNNLKSWPPFENMSEKDKDYWRARAQQFEELYPPKK